MKISEIFNNPNIQYVIGLFPDLEYDSGLLEDYDKFYYSTSKPKAKALFENYELIFNGTSVWIRFYYEYKGIKVYFKNATPYLLGKNHNGKKIKNLENSNELRKVFISEGYNYCVVDKALKELKTLACDTSPIEKLLKDIEFSINEFGRELIIHTDQVSLKLFTDIAQVMNLKFENLQIQNKTNEDGHNYFELKWNRE